MKRLWIAIALLLTVVAASIGNLGYLTRTVRSMTALLDGAVVNARQGNWPESQTALYAAKQLYDQSEVILSITINEKQLDEVALNFARAQAGFHTDDRSGCEMELAGLRESVEDLLRSEELSFGNLF